ncbi:2-oxoglutarate dehydrogenase E1 component [Geomobilimonas luticola]|uniref:oxoglutarate dehydrogenase (succinyl-transferring) n=1 Tax=Geomobilimonas luticola TaxID=1114878 RepID=A0ABS5SFG1_9BACT|nr:2-oxoglutarate dehydrogenase E1 component [Geomobilimonas luticola]MBT0653249.1 2-oxoglutarate dehydrogenase E1 component [Geomobilimonas luticola]
MSFIDNISPEWLEAQYLRWQENPDDVSAEWRAFFGGFDLGAAALPVAAGGECLDPAMARKQSGVQSLIYRYRDIGHLLACTDPLSPCRIDHPLLSLSAFDLDESDLDTTFYVRRFKPVRAAGSDETADPYAATLREILSVMRETYCRSIGAEFMHIQDPAERQWFMDRMEPVRNRPNLTLDERLAILGKLQEAALFEGFLNRKFMGQTRFSLEGGETLIPVLDAVVAHAARLGVTDLIVGMPHRGRLSVLATIFRKPLAAIFAEFADNLEHNQVGEGDVKYHKGFSIDVQTPEGKMIHLALAANPSHLEAIDPVVEGKCRARQDRYDDGRGEKVLPLLIHGDAAFAGQGMVTETLNLSQLPGYRTGGTLHIVLNNQIGFTTPPEAARSSFYSTDAAKMIMAPILHVHGEDPEAAVHAVRLALDYRQAFGRDVVVEIICYRRYGHNEGDEPYFTQPLMYGKIKDRPSVHFLYADSLREAGVTEERITVPAAAYTARLEQALEERADGESPGFQGEWRGVQRAYSPAKVATGVAREALVEVAEVMSAIPAGFTPHAKVAALLKRRRDTVTNGEGIDWGTGESLAFASLLREGHSIRLSGQDVRRGTFSSRHSVLIDMGSEDTWIPLSAAATQGAKFMAFDSMLSENAVLGFEYGYSLETPAGLTIWEAQYGDFANGAQVIIDQFIASGETKWDRVSGLVMLLPHGYEGQGAEHSSARIERFLQLCGGANLQVAYPSTPAQYFHLLRRQLLQPFRKPLVVFTPKSLLRHPLCVSRLEEFTEGWFREVIPGPAPPDRVTTVLFCAGKIYYELLERKKSDGREDVALVRIEQLYPLRTDLLRESLASFHGAAGFRWVQEEPRNMGAWQFIRSSLADITGTEPMYIGRPEAAAPAVGSHRQHMEEQERLISAAFQV